MDRTAVGVIGYSHGPLMRKALAELLPHPHFMSLAPLDVWARTLWSPRARVPMRYWTQLAGCLFTSLVGTLLTLPERVLLAPLWMARSRRQVLHPPGVVFVLGYYRSGTTHLHNLLSCDPSMRSPTWCQCLAPHGFVVAWAFLRLFLIPFLPDKRPQDDVPFGPDWPAEEDFALNNAGPVSPLVGRFVLPELRAHYQRYHDLQDLTPAERARWRRIWLTFLAKQSVLAGSRMILLKTPAHTARVGEILEVLGAEHCRFVYIDREREAVVKSNVAMQARLGPHLLQEPPGADEVRGVIEREVAHTLERFEADATKIPAGRLVRVGFDELVRDPEATLDRVYREWGLERSEASRERVARHLASVSGHRIAHGSGAASAVQADARGSGSQERAKWRGMRGAAAAIGVALLAIPAWLAWAWLVRDRSDWLVWPIGVAVGYAALRGAGVGRVGLGWLAAGLAVLVYAACALPATFLADYGQRANYFAAPGAARALGGLSPWIPMDQWEWYHIKLSTKDGVLAINNIFWLVMGVASAYRFASRRHVHPPGR